MGAVRGGGRALDRPPQEFRPRWQLYVAIKEQVARMETRMKPFFRATSLHKTMYSNDVLKYTGKQQTELFLGRMLCLPELHERIETGREFKWAYSASDASLLFMPLFWGLH